MPPPPPRQQERVRGQQGGGGPTQRCGVEEGGGGGESPVKLEDPGGLAGRLRVSVKLFGHDSVLFAVVHARPVLVGRSCLPGTSCACHTCAAFL